MSKIKRTVDAAKVLGMRDREIRELFEVLSKKFNLLDLKKNDIVIL